MLGPGVPGTVVIILAEVPKLTRKNGSATPRTVDQTCVNPLCPTCSRLLMLPSIAPLLLTGILRHPWFIGYNGGNFRTGGVRRGPSTPAADTLVLTRAAVRGQKEAQELLNSAREGAGAPPAKPVGR